MAGGSKSEFSTKEAYDGAAFAVRERLVESFNKTMQYMKYAMLRAAVHDARLSLPAPAKPHSACLQGEGSQVRLLPLRGVPDGSVSLEHRLQPGSKGSVR